MPNHATAKKLGILLDAYSMIATWFRSVCSYWNRVGLKNANLFSRSLSKFFHNIPAFWRYTFDIFVNF